MTYFTPWPEQEDDRVKRGHDENFGVLGDMWAHQRPT
jgi:hypothetical protein